MAEGALQQLDAAQRERLVALGYELYVLRGTAASGRGVAATAKTASAELGAGVATRVAARALADGRDHAAPEAGSHASRLTLRGVDSPRDDKLLVAVLRMLGVDPAQASMQPREGVPEIAFGGDASSSDRTVLPSLEAFRRGAAKRAAWPALRRLRRLLHRPDRSR